MSSFKLMTHIYYGDISPEFSESLAVCLSECGSDILEIGIPYSDPVCDGLIFQKSCAKALENGITPYKVLDGIENIKSKISKEIYLTTYYAPLFKIGIKHLLKRAKNCGITGVIVPDIIHEEQGELIETCDGLGLSLPQFATVYSDNERLKTICAAATGFIYCVSLPGVTGDNITKSYKQLKILIRKLKKITDKNLYVGFGIRDADTADEIIKMGADGIIIGSAIAGICANETDKQIALAKITELISSITAINSSRFSVHF